MSKTARQRSKSRREVAARLTHPSIWQCLGPGLITGAADDDPSGIATYSQTGAKFGLATLWTLWLTYPLMVAMQFASALIGRVTGKGLAANLKSHYPAPVLYVLVSMLFVANTINLGADIGAMGEAIALLCGGPSVLYATVSALVALCLLVLLRFRTYARILKYLTLSLLAYVGVIVFVDVPWSDVARALVMPHISWTADYITAVVAIFGTTISPYLFFWQASHEVEQQAEAPKERPLRGAPEQGAVQLRRVRWDTLIGMGISNLVAFCIMLTAGSVLFPRGVNDIASAAQAAEALRPIAGKLSFFLFAAGIVGTGMLAIPTLAGSVAYAVAETFHWPKGLDKRLHEAWGFYAVVGLGTALGIAMCFTSISPMRALFWSAVINGVTAVPLMVFIMLIASSKRIMGKFSASAKLRAAGWAATVVMLAATVAMFATWK